MVSERASECTFFGVSALLFAASAAVTIVWCASMAAMGDMATDIPGRPGHQNHTVDGLTVHVLAVSVVDGAQESSPCPIR
jgi:hypothetical protein